MAKAGRQAGRRAGAEAKDVQPSDTKRLPRAAQCVNSSSLS